MLYLVFLVLLTVASVTPGTAKAVYRTVDPEQAPILFNIFKNCADKLGLDSKIMEKALNWKFENNELENKYIHCFGNTSGVRDDAGNLIKDKVLLLVGDHITKEEYIKYLDECNKLQGNDKYDTTFKVVNCLRDTSPILLKL